MYVWLLHPVIFLISGRAVILINPRRVHSVSTFSVCKLSQYLTPYRLSRKFDNIKIWKKKKKIYQLLISSKSKKRKLESIQNSMRFEMAFRSGLSKIAGAPARTAASEPLIRYEAFHTVAAFNPLKMTLMNS